MDLGIYDDENLKRNVDLIVNDGSDKFIEANDGMLYEITKPMTDNEIIITLSCKQLEQLITIKKCFLFFLVLAIMGLVVSFLGAF